MGTIVKRINPSGEVVYRAQIKISRQGYPKFSESKTFSKKSLAKAWLKKREAEIEANPDIMWSEKKTAALPHLARSVRTVFE